MQSSPIVGFDIDDHQIRGLIRFLEMTSRDLENEDDVQVASVLITKGDIMRYGHSFQLASTGEDPFNRTTLVLVDLEISLGWAG